ncbi:serine hydrolase FSH, partial [Coemansia spiralis]
VSSMLRVLCLHGYTQNAQKFRDRTGPFRRNLKRRLEMVYVTAPLQATEFQSAPASDASDAADGGDGPSAAWWNRTSPSDTWDGIKQSTRFLVQVMAEQGPFDGIVGFSQGSGMAAILAALMHASHSPLLGALEDDDLRLLALELRALPPLKFAILFAGFFPDVPQFAELIEKTGRVPTRTLHMVGQRDAIVPMARGRQLAEQAFDGAVAMEHEGGHFVPCNAAWRRKYQEFL